MAVKQRELLILLGLAVGLPCASFGATGRWRATTGAVDDVKLVLNFAIDLFKERVVKLDGEER